MVKREWDRTVQVDGHTVTLLDVELHIEAFEMTPGAAWREYVPGPVTGTLVVESPVPLIATGEPVPVVLEGHHLTGRVTSVAMPGNRPTVTTLELWQNPQGEPVRP